MVTRALQTANTDPSVTLSVPLPNARTRRVQRIRRQIAEGTYETDAKLEAVIPGLIGDLGLAPPKSSRPSARAARPM